MLPLIRSQISASVTAICGEATSAVAWPGQPAFASPIMPTAEQIWPGVQ